MPNSQPTISFPCTLVPLLRDGRHCLFYHDVKEIDSAELERVEFYSPGVPWHRVVWQSDDIFALVEQKVMRWPLLEGLSAAYFRIRLRNDRRLYRIMVRPPARSVNHLEGLPVIDAWLQQRKFMESPTGENKSVE